MKKIFFLYFLCVSFLANAEEYKCAAGYYLDNDNETCIQCRNGAGNEYGYYCPGDDTQHPCPTIPNDENAKYFRYYARWGTGNLNKSISNCRVHYSQIPIEHGKLWISCPYDSVSESYYTSSCQIENTYSSGSLTQCDAGYYAWRGPGNYNIGGNFSTNVNYNHCKPVGYGYYSQQNYTLRTICPNGTYTETTTSANSANCLPCINLPQNAEYSGANINDNTAICPFNCDTGYGHTDNDTCEQLCTAGISELHIAGPNTNEIIFNVYAARRTEHTLNIGHNNTVCYVQTAVGSQSGALNFKINGETYHTIN